MEDATGKPRPVADVEAALRWANAELVVNPTRMGPKDTGPAAMHLIVIRDVLREYLITRGGDR